MEELRNVKSIFWLSEYEEMNLPASAEFYDKNGKSIRKIEGIEKLTVKSGIKKVRFNSNFVDIEFRQPVNCQIRKIKEEKPKLISYKYEIECR